MQDRVPVNPGRVLIAPENGGAAYYATLTRADNPTQEGTALNKANLLTDATAALFGLDASAVPNDVFSMVAPLSQHWWKRRATAGSYSVIETAVSEKMLVYTNSGTLYYADSYILNEDDHTVSLVNETELVLTSRTDSNRFLIRGKYFRGAEGADSEADIFFLPEDGDLASSSSSGKVTTYDAYSVSVVYNETTGAWEFVRSGDRAAYPDNGTDGGYEYGGYLGTVLSNSIPGVKIATGSYTGTGKYGSGNKNKLIFDFVPKFVIIQGSKYYSNIKADCLHIGILTQGCTGAFTSEIYAYRSKLDTSDNELFGVTVSWSANTVTWYAGANYQAQLNESGYTYGWIAIG